MAKNKVRMDLDDRVWGISGTVNPNDYWEAARGKDSDMDLGYVKYKPAIKAKKYIPSLVSRFLSKLPLFDSFVGDGEKRIPEAIPKSQVIEVYTPPVSGKDKNRNGAGQPDRKLVLLEDKDGNAPYEDRVKDREKNKIGQLEKEKNRAESESITAKARSIDLESEDEENQGARRPGRSPERRDEVMP